MKKIVQLNIADEYIEGAGVSIGAAGSHDETEIECHFSELWENTTKTVCWINSMGESVTVTVTPLMDVDGNGNTYRVPIPAEAKKYSGEAGLTIKGCLIDNETGAEYVAVFAETAYFLVLKAEWGEGETEDITPSKAEQLQSEIDEIKETIGDAQKSAAAAAESYDRASACADIAAKCMNNASVSADDAEKSAEYVIEQARNSESWAVGGTGTRENEDVNNAKYWSEQAQNAAGGGVTSFNGRQGVVMPDKNDYTPDFIGAMDKSVYDADGDGVVDKADLAENAENAEKLNGQPASYYATKTEVQTAQSTSDAAMPKSGGTFTGAVTLKADPTSNLHPATKQYVDNKPGMDLLWTNASPTSNFDAQTVSLDLSKYKAIKIRFRFSTTNAVAGPITEQNIDDVEYRVVFWGGNSRVQRGVTAKTTGVVFTNSGASDVPTTAPGNSTNHCIPTHIYGVK